MKTSWRAPRAASQFLLSRAAVELLGHRIGLPQRPCIASLIEPQLFIWRFDVRVTAVPQVRVIGRASPSSPNDTLNGQCATPLPKAMRKE